MQVWDGWQMSRAVIALDHALSLAAALAAALACGIGRRTEEEAKDLLLQDAPEDLYAALLEKLGPERAAQVPAVAAALRAPLHPNCFLSPTQFAEKFGLPKPEVNHGTHETHGKGEVEMGSTVRENVSVSTETAAHSESVPVTSEHPQVASDQTSSAPRPAGFRPFTAFFLVVLGVIVGTLCLPREPLHESILTENRIAFVNLAPNDLYQGIVAGSVAAGRGDAAPFGVIRC